MAELASKVALVTGGASGIGLACARAIVAEGGKVMIGDVSDDAGRAVADDLGAAASYVHLDITSPADWADAVNAGLTTFGKLNVLVNNAGIITGGALGEYSLDDWRRIIDVNLTGVFLGMSACVGALKESAPSSIVNMSSVAGLQGAAGFHGYCASKWGIRGITKSAALELAPFGIRVNSVHPGTIRTPMTADVPESMADNSAFGRFGEAEEVANLVVYLASDRASFSTAAEFKVDGGESAG
ncbi:SDR family oxidoreductase [Amycolatopsis sp.]|jgi:3alpha(or 20beta)-hydroxysteroid dehydrogenase|uniref:SDR family oxidoreductase n=1 Tax=Amycolatopsis sp. TaxID=37632 RepID=UPI002DFBF204|nr:SDR family oxidoreductase [Amycolatopsis sp.]